MTELVDEARVQRALDYLIKTDEEFAKAKSYMEGIDRQEKSILAAEFLKSEGSIEVRKAVAATSEAYKNWQEYNKQAVLDYEIMRNKRNTADLIIELYRTLCANRRKGNV